MWAEARLAEGQSAIRLYSDLGYKQWDSDLLVQLMQYSQCQQKYLLAALAEGRGPGESL